MQHKSQKTAIYRMPSLPRRSGNHDSGKPVAGLSAEPSDRTRGQSHPAPTRTSPTKSKAAHVDTHTRTLKWRYAHLLHITPSFSPLTPRPTLQSTGVVSVEIEAGLKRNGRARGLSTSEESSRDANCKTTTVLVSLECRTNKQRHTHHLHAMRYTSSHLPI